MNKLKSTIGETEPILSLLLLEGKYKTFQFNDTYTKEYVSVDFKWF